MTFDEWLQKQLDSGRFAKGADGRIWDNSGVVHLPVSTEGLQNEYQVKVNGASWAPNKHGLGSTLQGPGGSALPDATPGAAQGVDPGDPLGIGGQKFNPAAFTLDKGPSGEMRGQQQAFMAGLQKQMAGEGPSLAQGQLQKATDENIRQAMALGAAQQGQGLGGQAALRNIQAARTEAQQQAAGQSAMQRNLEQMQATQMLGGELGGARGQDIQEAMEQLRAKTELAKAQYGANAAAQGNVKDLVSGLGQGAMKLATEGADIAKSSGAGTSGGYQGYDITKDPGAVNYGPSSPSDWSNPYGGYAFGGPVDNKANDTVPAMLSPGEVVLPRSVSMAEDAPERAKAFVEAIMAMKRRKKTAVGA